MLNVKAVAIPRTAVWKIQIRSDETDTWLLAGGGERIGFCCTHR